MKCDICGTEKVQLLISWECPVDHNVSPPKNSLKVVAWADWTFQEKEEVICRYSGLQRYRYYDLYRCRTTHPGVSVIRGLRWDYVSHWEAELRIDGSMALFGKGTPFLDETLDSLRFKTGILYHSHPAYHDILAAIGKLREI